MSGYRAVVGYGVLKRGNKEAIAELPLNTDGKTRLRPDELIAAPSTYLDGGIKWNRFGAGVDAEITIERNINFHNDIGKRTYTVATTGIAEPSITINGYVSAEYLDWMRFALNVDESTQTISTTTSNTTTDTFSYEHPNGVRTFDIMYVQMNSKTNDYAGYDEYHILTGCAVSTVTFSYELGSDAGVKFSIEILALMDWYSLVDENSTDINTYLEDIPADVFSTGCISKSTDGSTYEAVAQTDSASLTISNFVERRGNCNTNYGSGYSMGTLNVEMDTSTYSNDPKKYMMAMYGYSDAATKNTYGMKKTPYQIPYIRFHTENGDSIDGTTKTKEIDIVINKVIPTSLNKSYSSESAILDSPKLRGENIIFTVKYPSITSETVIKTPTGKTSTTGSS
jgi:hypothetical protein